MANRVRLGNGNGGNADWHRVGNQPGVLSLVRFAVTAVTVTVFCFTRHRLGLQLR
jgi:hypothetical protein